MRKIIKIFIAILEKFSKNKKDKPKEKQKNSGNDIYPLW